MGTTLLVQGALVNHPSQALKLDCADAVVPALKDNFSRLDRLDNILIMFDEAHAEMIIRCKKVFQAGMNLVTYGSSATNLNVTHAWLHGIQLVIGAHVWLEELERPKPYDRQWVEDNSVHVVVDAPMWVQE